MTVRLGVAGWPVSHSRSPVMQNAALAASGLATGGGGAGESWRYQLLPIPPALFTETVLGLRGSGFRGINATIPHKAAALALATDPTPRARAIGAANTLLFESDGTIVADNTDGTALAAALAAKLPGGAAGRSALVLGAGGSSRAAVWALLEAGARSVQVWNRTAARAVELCTDIGAEPVADMATLSDGVEMIVNCTSVGLDDRDSLDALPLSEELLANAEVIADYVYRPAGTVLGHAAERLGVPFVDGLELLVLQGAEGFTLFTGRPAPVDAMRPAARG